MGRLGWRLSELASRVLWPVTDRIWTKRRADAVGPSLTMPRQARKGSETALEQRGALEACLVVHDPETDATTLENGKEHAGPALEDFKFQANRAR
jgi:hypothetical protein